LKTGKATDFEGAELIRHSLVYAGFKILVRLPDWNREGLKIPLLLDMALLFVCLNRACLDFVQEGLAEKIMMFGAWMKLCLISHKALL
jgi:hypothetical protein